MRFVKAGKSRGEEVRRELALSGSIDQGYPILHEGDSILIPVKGDVPGHEMVEREAEPRPVPVSSLSDALEGVLSAEELSLLMRSFDIIGDIAIIEIPDALATRSTEIGQALMTVHRNVKAVFRKGSAMEGEYRVRRLERIAGEDRTTTLYRESGTVMELDLAKVYFSVRLATERERIADLVRPGEKVLVLFAGVGPFALVIAKRKPDSSITALELNPDAVRYLKRNIELNGFSNIEAIEGDAHGFQRTGFDRVVMPLPKSASEFLAGAMRNAKDGGAIHYYTFSSRQDAIGSAFAKVKGIAEEAGFEATLESGHIVRPYAPEIVQVVLDLRISRIG